MLKSENKSPEIKNKISAWIDAYVLLDSDQKKVNLLLDRFLKLAHDNQDAGDFLPHELLQALQDESTTFETLHNNAEQMKAMLISLPLVNLVLAYFASDNELRRYAKLLRVKLQRSIIVSTSYDPQVLGGVIIESGGKRFDFSLKFEVDQLFSQYKI